VAKPRQEHSAAADAAARRASVQRRAPRAPRPANDNVSLFSRRLFRLVPLLLAAAMFCWALWSTFFVT
jgi:hypothetical protein